MGIASAFRGEELEEERQHMLEVQNRVRSAAQMVWVVQNTSCEKKEDLSGKGQKT